MRRGKEIGGSGGGRRGVERHRLSGEEGTKGAKLLRKKRKAVGKKLAYANWKTNRKMYRHTGIYIPTYVRLNTC